MLDKISVPFQGEKSKDNSPLSEEGKERLRQSHRDCTTQEILFSAAYRRKVGEFSEGQAGEVGPDGLLADMKARFLEMSAKLIAQAEFLEELAVKKAAAKEDAYIMGLCDAKQSGDAGRNS